MTKDAVSKLVTQLIKKHKFKFDKKDKEALTGYAYKVMNNPNTYSEMEEEEREKHKKHAVYTMMEIVSNRNNAT